MTSYFILGKSVLVTNSTRIADIVKKRLAAICVAIKIQCAARDLGATFVGWAAKAHHHAETATARGR